MSEDHQHESVIKTPKQLIAVVVLAFLIPILGIAAIASLVSTGGHASDANNEAAVVARIKPVGTVVIDTSQPALPTVSAAVTAVPAASTVAVAVPAIPAAATASAAKPDGKKVYDTACMACHGAGIAGAPKLGDKEAWLARIAQGLDTLHAHAIKGFQGKTGVMPPKGGNMALSDADVSAAVDFMVAGSK